MIQRNLFPVSHYPLKHHLLSATRFLKTVSVVFVQVITSIGELVEMCSPQILSGWRPLFSALRTVHGSKTDTKDYLLGEYSMGTPEALTFYKTRSSFPDSSEHWKIFGSQQMLVVIIVFLSIFFRLISLVLLPSFSLSFFSRFTVPTSPVGKSQAPVFDVFEAFINTDNIQVFANAATDYIMCLMKFVKGLGLWICGFYFPGIRHQCV